LLKLHPRLFKATSEMEKFIEFHPQTGYSKKI